MFSIKKKSVLNLFGKMFIILLNISLFEGCLSPETKPEKNKETLSSLIQQYNNIQDPSCNNEIDLPQNCNDGSCLLCPNQEECNLLIPPIIDTPSTPNSRYVTPDLNRKRIVIPKDKRQKNYGPSCVHASLATLFNYAERDDWGDWWTSNYSGGEYETRLHKRLSESGILYDYTNTGSVTYLKNCLNKNRPVIVHCKPAHMCILVGLDPKVFKYKDLRLINTSPYAVIIDPNHPDKEEYIPREEFIKKWQSLGGWGTSIYFSKK